jgi:hypothetical protein
VGAGGSGKDYFLLNTLLRGNVGLLDARSVGSVQGEDRDAAVEIDGALGRGNITYMALVRKRATTIALDPRTDSLLSRAARAQRISRSEFIRQQLELALEQYRSHPRPRIAGIVKQLRERGNESELFRRK